jgi:hypothetical protein
MPVVIPVSFVTLPLILAEKIYLSRGCQILMTDLHIQDILRNRDEQRIHSRIRGNDTIRIKELVILICEDDICHRYSVPGGNS